MRFAVIANVHANDLVIAAVFADISEQGNSRHRQFGRYASGPFDARRTIEMMVARDAACVCGNHDRYLADLLPGEMCPSDRSTRARPFGRAHLEWQRALPKSMVYREKCFSLPCDAVLAGIESNETRAEGISQSLIQCAHTHVPRSVFEMVE